jgi:hypothetical protein
MEPIKQHPKATTTFTGTGLHSLGMTMRRSQGLMLGHTAHASRVLKVTSSVRPLSTVTVSTPAPFSSSKMAL